MAGKKKFSCHRRILMDLHDNVNAMKKKSEQFEALFNASRDKLYAVAQAIVRDKDLADDVLQTAQIKAWSKFDTYDPEKNFMNWMTTIVRNASIDVKRNKGKQAYLSIEAFTHTQEDFGQSKQFEFEDKSANIFKQYENKERLDTVYTMIQTLPEDLKEVIMMLSQEKTYKEIADATELPISTVRTKVHRARKILTKCAEMQNFEFFNV